MRNIIYIFCFLCLFPLKSFGYDPNTKLSIITHIFPPFSYSENNEIKGMSTEILLEVLKEMKHKNYQIKVLPWKRALLTVWDSKNLLLYPFARKPNREEYFIWVGKAGPRLIGLYKLKSRKGIVANDIDQAKKYKVGSLRGTAYTKKLHENGFKIINEVTLPIQNIKMLYRKKIDLVLEDEAVLFHSIKLHNKEVKDEKRLDESQIERTLFFSPTTDRWFGFGAKSDQDLVNKFEDAYKTLEKRGVIKQINSKYFAR